MPNRSLLLGLVCAALFLSGCDLSCTPRAVVSMQPKIPYGGRAVAVGTDPTDDQTAFVVSESGGIFRSRNGGSIWQQVTGTSSFWFSDVVVLPTDPHVIVAAAFHDTRVVSGGGIWRSTDGGYTWSHVPIAPPNADPLEAYCLAVEPGSPPRLWAGTSAGLAYSDDRGAHWSFLASLGTRAVDAVVAPNPKHLRVVTASGFRSSNDRGLTWLAPESSASVPYPENQAQLAVSPRHDDVVYWCGVHLLENGETDTRLVRTQDRGRTWSKVCSFPTSNRSSFVRTTSRALTSADKYQVYFGDGSTHFVRANVEMNSEHQGDWQTLVTEHPDCSDIAFKADGYTPWLLTGDGGLQGTTDKGAHWKLTGGGHGGYNALQISDAVGQVHSDDEQASDFYFGTQDVGFWGSRDDGNSWPDHIPNEGYHLEIPARPGTSEINRLTFVNYFGGGRFEDYMTGPRFENPQVLEPPVEGAEGMRRLAGRTYFKKLNLPDTDPGIQMWITRDNGATWQLRGVTGPGMVTGRDRVKTARIGGQPSLFFHAAEDVARNYIKRVTGFLDAGNPIVSDLLGPAHVPGASAIAPSSNNPLVWEIVYGVDPYDPNHAMVLDSQAQAILVTHDGGGSWSPDEHLKSLITGDGTFRLFFGQDRPQVTLIDFDPDIRGRILIGTVQAGVFFSCDYGMTWSKLKGSEVIPNVSSFHRTPAGWILASSYGRGLWRLRLECPKGEPPVLFHAARRPYLVTEGVLAPLSSLDPDSRLSFLVAREGEIAQVRRTGRDRDSIATIEVTGGRIERLARGGFSATDIAFEKSAARGVIEDSTAAKLLRDGFRIVGVATEGRRFRGYLLAPETLSAEDLPKPRPVDCALGIRYLVADRSRATLYGRRFEPGVPVRLTLQGAAMWSGDTTVVADARGVFQLKMRVPRLAGRYAFVAEQAGPRGRLRAEAPLDVLQED